MDPSGRFTYRCALEVRLKMLDDVTRYLTTTRDLIEQLFPQLLPVVQASSQHTPDLP